MPRPSEFVTPSEPALSMPLPAAHPASPSLVIAGEDDIRLTRGPRSYRVRGMARNLSAEVLKVTLRLSAGAHLHLDTLDLYQARQEQRTVSETLTTRPLTERPCSLQALNARLIDWRAAWNNGSRDTK